MSRVVNFLLLSFFISQGASAVGLSSEDLIGDYHGDKGCVIKIASYPGNMLQIKMIKRGYTVASEFLAKYRVESIAEDGEFKIEQEYHGFSGKETKEISGEIKNFSLTSLELSRRQSAFSVSKEKCKDLVKIRRF
ncbi:MAG: hypothetical protein CME60_08495 [Halobacteriovoraceae bacterium]|nr:hypothetical protein [Halobacteriovoraceae bacterium]